MLSELNVENLLLIERAQMRLVAGLNVLTGETGAGKTVLAHALDLLLGGRARQGIVRPGAAEAYVEGVFDLDEPLRKALDERIGADAEDLVLARRVGSDGRTRAYLNGRSIPVSALRDIGAMLLSFYGQHEHRRLTLAGAQLRILDDLGGAAHARELDACADAHDRRRALEQRLLDLHELSAQRERELDLLAFELGEIAELGLSEEEHERLLAVRERLRRLDSLRAAAAGAAEALSPLDGDAPGVAQLAARAGVSLDAVAEVDPRLDALAERLRALQIEAEELAHELHAYRERGLEDALDGLALDDLSLEGVETRLAAIERVVRKHGGTVVAVLDFERIARARREELEGAEVALGNAGEELARVESELSAHAAALRKRRRASAKTFARDVQRQLAALAMAEASFEVSFEERDSVGPTGADGVEFMIAPNPGVPAGPLREIASGGELSRVMLAIMSAAASSSARATLVFDEVDAGIGGHTARAVGARLRELADRGQVLCITHLPQIASLGTRHFTIVKDTSAEPTRTSVLELAEAEVEDELVRMLGAESGDSAALRHARDLRRAA
ncbi:MAG TPA: DNA repair protein RecN [Solirubrobacteraceae bacterium]|jgi:DNA repair protein RecN (Recombination protein N)